jgi:hypothetical protein
MAASIVWASKIIARETCSRFMGSSEEKSRYQAGEASRIAQPVLLQAFKVGVNVT